MGKHERSYARVEREGYQTPALPVTDALAEHLDLAGLMVWECACGKGHNMAATLRQAGAARVYTSDIVDYGNDQDEVLDFLSAQNPRLERFDAIITNPPFGQGGRLATAFIDSGLRRLGPNGILALLLPCDFDSAKSRARYFADCRHFVGKIVLSSISCIEDATMNVGKYG